MAPMRRALWLLVLGVGCGDDGGATGDGGLRDGGADALPPDGCGDECVPADSIYVSAVVGDDANSGAKDAPVKTVHAGLSLAREAGVNVVVGEGTYTEAVTLAEGVDLLGGYHCAADACDWTRDINLYVSTIAAIDPRGLVATSSITSATLVSGFTIRGLDGEPMITDGGRAVTIEGGSVTLRGNKIIAGAVGPGNDGEHRSVGISIRETTTSTPIVIENNEITGGTGDTSIGIAMDTLDPSLSALVTISSNVIRTRTARSAYGIYALYAKAGSVASNNDIVVGTTTGGESFGMLVSGPVKIDANRVNVDRMAVGVCMQATSWCGGIAVEGNATAPITNNIAYGPRGSRTAGLVIAQFSRATGPIVATNNFFSGGGTATFGGGTRGQSAAVALVTGDSGVALAPDVGTLRNNIFDGGSSNVRFGVRESLNVDRIHPVVLEANAFVFTALSNRDDVLLREIAADGDIIDHTSLIGMELTSNVPTLNNLDGNPLLDATLHLAATSPLIDVGSTLGAPATDFEGDPRPGGQGIDIGPDEAN